ISKIAQLMPILDKVMRDPRPLVILAEKIEGAALSMLVHNHVNGLFQCVAITAPGFGDRRLHKLEDIASVTGGAVFSKHSGFSLETMTIEQLGALKPEQISRLTFHQLRALTATQLASLSDTQVGALNALQLASLGTERITALTTGQVDVLVSALVVAPERTQDVAYTDSYFDAGQALFVPPGSAVAGMADLDGRTLAVELGALGHVEARAWQERLPGLAVVTFGSADEALAAAASGAAGAALVDSVSGRLYLRDHAGSALLRLDPPVAPEPYAVAVRIGDRTLHRRLNDALASLARSGQLEEITSRWLGP
ncbi:MAG TPA: transporter substrate-binding domain-containing protein, partial [Promineifilum sp.]|nr:transporter substrate-binding domain-containing protein [Promineifilum sp.]